MHTGAITDYIDVAQVAIWTFWLFFAGLVFWLRQEDKREGYPLVSGRPGDTRTTEGFPPMPKPKTFILPHGGTQTAPRFEPPAPEPKAVPVGNWHGAPLQPTGNPMIDGVGPSGYAQRRDEPDQALDGSPRILPLRAAPAFFVEENGPDPRGFKVIAADGKVAGTVTDVWVDVTEAYPRYFEVNASGRRVLLPIGFARVTLKDVNVKSILASQFADVPTLRNPDRVTLREEDRICAYYAGGHLYATPSRSEPLI